jgi:hypothetical protein
MDWKLHIGTDPQVMHGIACFAADLARGRIVPIFA